MMRPPRPTTVASTQEHDIAQDEEDGPRKRRNMMPPPSGPSMDDGFLQHREPMLVQMTPEVASADDGALTVHLLTYADTFPTAFNFDSGRSIRRRLSAHSADSSQTDGAAGARAQKKSTSIG